jgi:hypothetical protein
MEYITPNNVRSPKDSISDLEVVYDGGESGDEDQEGYSICHMTWEDGKSRMGIRWNGNEKGPVGNPQSRGIPTWFILPEKVETLFYVGALIWEKAISNADEYRMLSNFLTEKITRPELSALIGRTISALQHDRKNHVAKRIAKYASGSFPFRAG